MKIRPMEHIRLHLNDLALRHVHVMFCPSEEGWVVAVTVQSAGGAIETFCAGSRGRLSVFGCMSSAATALAGVGVQQFTVTQQPGVAA